MFNAETYALRRKLLKKQIKSGLLVFLGNDESPMNYPANTYPFRQDSTFLYFFGLDSPGLAAIVDVDESIDMLFGDDIGLEDIIWMGHLPTLRERARGVGVRRTAPREKFDAVIRAALKAGRTVHYLPPYRADAAQKLQNLMKIPLRKIKAGASLEFIKAVVGQRVIKTKEEIREIEAALDVTYDMYRFGMKNAKPGRIEQEIAGGMEGLALARGYRAAFPPIVTVNGQILHNHHHENVLSKGRLLVVDMGAESPLRYASDITRTIPVGGKFNRRQRDVYEIVLAGQEKAIRSIKPGVMYKEIHLKAARTMAEGLVDLGLMKGNVKTAVAEGAHALFFPHGLGHHLGLDVHDMEDLGENHVGYDKTVQRSDQFGLAYLRMAKALEPGHVLTVEPGIYFIPALFAKWKKERKHLGFINYDRIERFLDFGGVRIEDDVLVTKTGRRVLGKPIPKTVDEIEKACR
jgi:Xaa-Pro aminopeptidase